MTSAICPVCKSAATKQVLTCTDYTVSKQPFNIWECSTCTLRFTYPAPDEKAILPYYQSDAYISHSDSSKGLINKLYKGARSYTLKWKLQLVKNKARLQTGRLLDIGAGTGAFVNTMAEAGWNGVGLEPDAGARKLAKKNYGITLQPSENLFLLPEQSFDVVTMWHVLEHVHRLHEYVDQIRKLLKSGGVALIAVPNYTSKDAQHYGKFWAAYDVPRHLYHFSPAAMRKLAELHRMDVRETTPMRLDAYYIAMLSEKYKAGKGNLLKAVWSGFNANMEGGEDKEKYSSLVYVIQSLD
jgi:SAM-dependent methyltransferase